MCYLTKPIYGIQVVYTNSNCSDYSQAQDKSLNRRELVVYLRVSKAVDCNELRTANCNDPSSHQKIVHNQNYA